jgi:hypothetical protein
MIRTIESDALFEAIGGLSKAKLAHLAAHHDLVKLHEAADAHLQRLEKVGELQALGLSKSAAESAATAPALFPAKPGVIPFARPNTGTRARSPKSTARRGKLREMFVDAGITVTGSNAQTLESLLDAMEAYVENAISL